MHELAQIEDIVITALTPLISNIGVKTLAAYTGQFDVDGAEKIIVQFPCIYVAPAETIIPENSQTKRLLINFSVFVGDRNTRSDQAVMRGDAYSPGVYSLLEETKQKLHNKKLISGFRSFKLKSERPLFFAPQKRMCLYEAIYQTEV